MSNHLLEAVLRTEEALFAEARIDTNETDMLVFGFYG